MGLRSGRSLPRVGSRAGSERKLLAAKLTEQDWQPPGNPLGVPAANRPVGVDKVGAGWRPSTTVSQEVERKQSLIKLKKVRLDSPLEAIDSEAAGSDPKRGNELPDATSDL